MKNSSNKENRGLAAKHEARIAVELRNASGLGVILPRGGSGASSWRISHVGDSSKNKSDIVAVNSSLGMRIGISCKSSSGSGKTQLTRFSVEDPVLFHYARELGVDIPADPGVPPCFFDYPGGVPSHGEDMAALLPVTRSALIGKVGGDGGNAEPATHLFVSNLSERGGIDGEHWIVPVESVLSYLETGFVARMKGSYTIKAMGGHEWVSVVMFTRKGGEDGPGSGQMQVSVNPNGIAQAAFYGRMDGAVGLIHKDGVWSRMIVPETGVFLGC